MTLSAGRNQEKEANIERSASAVMLFFFVGMMMAEMFFFSLSLDRARAVIFCGSFDVCLFFVSLSLFVE